MKSAIVVLTGGIGSGKSAACEVFRGLGVPVVDADQIAHELTGPQGAAMPEIRKAFGDDVLGPDGRLDRTVMRERAFHDPSQRARLEAILHPQIQAHAMSALSASQAPYTLYAVPLWAEGAGQSRPEWVWKVLVMDVPVSLQRARVLSRQAISDETLDRILMLQASRAERLALADEVIQNEGTLDQLSAQVIALHHRWLDARSRQVCPDSLSNQT